MSEPIITPAAEREGDLDEARVDILTVSAESVG